MEVELNEAQKMLRDSARDFLVRECPKEVAKALEEDPEKGYSSETWSQIAELGWLGLIIPEEYGGEGMSFQDLIIILEEMGRNIFPGPYFCTAVAGSLLLQEAGTADQKQEFLPEIAKGNSILTLALVEGMSAYTPHDITATTVAEGDDFVINGTKYLVEMAHVADSIIYAARMVPGTTADGISLFIIDTKSPGIQIEVMPTMGMDKMCEVRFDDVRVSKDCLLGPQNDGWAIIRKVIDFCSIAKCAEAIGGMQESMKMSIAYAKERVQYDRPIGAYQVLQHWMADMYIAVETGKYLVYQAAWLASEGLPCQKEASLAKAYINEAYKSLTQKAVRIHGGMGTTRDHDIGLYFRRAKTMSLAFGDTRYHRERVADGIGLIRSVHC